MYLILLVGACDLRTLWSRVLQHHHHLRQAFASRFGFLNNATERKPEIELLVWKHERVATEKKKILILISSNQDIFFLLFFSSLLCPPPPLLSLAATQRSSSRPRSLVLGTRERPCPHRPCWEPENGRARSTRAGDRRAGRPFVTDPAQHPHGGPGRSVQELR